jgi:hypothetical protein
MADNRPRRRNFELVEQINQLEPRPSRSVNPLYGKFLVVVEPPGEFRVN